MAICEQVEDPRGAKGLVDRDVVRVITPGTILEEESLDPRTRELPRASLASDAEGYALAIADVSTGEVRVAEFGTAPREGGPALERGDLVEALGEEIARLGVKELVLSPAEQAIVERLTARAPGVFRSLIPEAWYDAADAVAWLGAAGADAAATPGSAGLAALGGLRAYLRETYRGSLDHLRVPELYRPAETLTLDHVTRTNLELVQAPAASGAARSSASSTARPPRWVAARCAVAARAAHEPGGDRAPARRGRGARRDARRCAAT